MQPHELEYVRETIEALVAELGPENVPAEIDVDGAIALLEAQETDDGNEEEIANVKMEEEAAE